MRPLILISALVWAGCAAETEPQHPPRDRFVYPSGIVHLPVANDPARPLGSLYVASANFDKCFDTGAVTALDLDALKLPPIGQTVGQAPAELTDLQVTEENIVEIDSFAGQMGVWNPPVATEANPNRTPRLFVPTRAEGNYLHAIDVDGTKLSCVNGLGNSCIVGALSLTSNIEGSSADLPRAPAPLGVTVGNVGNEPDVWVTHVEAADSPARSAKNNHTYVVHLPSANVSGSSLSISKDNFIPLDASGTLSIGGAHSTALGERYAYVSGRAYVAADVAQFAGFLLRLIDRTDTSRILETNLGGVYTTLEARDVLAGGYDPVQDKERIYLVARGPDVLLVLDVAGAKSASPKVSIINAVLLPGGASYATLIHRGDPKSNDDVIAITCTATTRIKGAVVLYDTRLGQIVAQIENVGSQPFGIAVHHPVRASQAAVDQARLFVTNFGDGRVAVIDVPDLAAPESAALVAYLGKRQGRDEKQGTSTCEEIQP